MLDDKYYNNLVPRGPFCHALEKSIPVADQKDRGLWERDCCYNRMFLKNLHENRVKFPGERNAFILVIQRGRRDVTCKPAILGLQPRDKAAMLVVNTIEFFLEEFK